MTKLDVHVVVSVYRLHYFQNIYSLAVLLLSENKIVRIFFASVVITALVNNVDKNSQVGRRMRFFAAANQMFGGSSQHKTTAEHCFVD